MAEKKYDIFISYRRDGGGQYARILQLELEKYNYKVFLDYEELTDGVFGDDIIKAIQSAPIFIMVLTPLHLTRSMELDNWVAREVRMAIEGKKHFIPVDPDRKLSGIPENPPVEIAALKTDIEGCVEEIENVCGQPISWSPFLNLEQAKPFRSILEHMAEVEGGSDISIVIMNYNTRKH